MAYQPITGPPVTWESEGLRAASGRGVYVNPADPIPGSERWQGGWEFQRRACGGGYRRDWCDRTPLDLDDVAPDPGTRRGQSFVIGAAARCSTFGSTAERLAEIAADARNLLNLVQYAQVGAELWRGDQARESGWDNPYLARDGVGSGFVNLMTENSLNPATDALSPTVGLAALEDALAACTPGLRLIHAPRAIVTLWGMGGTLRYEGGRLFTPAGTQVVAESSYDGSAPDSQANAAASLDGMWVYGTGPVIIRLDDQVDLYPATPEEMAAAVDRATNMVTFTAEKRAMVSFDCCHAGVRIQVTE